MSKLKQTSIKSVEPDTPNFIPNRWEQYFDLMQHLCYHCNTLIAVIGKQGVGKTTFMEQFISQIADQVEIQAITADEFMNANDLPGLLANAFQLPWSENSEISTEQQLENLLIHIQQRPQICVLLIDDAHYLSDSFIEKLFFLIKEQSDFQMRLHIVLVGNSNLQASLKEINEECPEQIQFLQLGPFNQEETRKYLELYYSNPVNMTPLPRKIYDKIYKRSGGYVAKINEAAQQVLQNPKFFKPDNSCKIFIRAHATKIIGIAVFVFIVAPIAFDINTQTSRPTHIELTLPVDTQEKNSNIVKKLEENTPKVSVTTDTPENSIVVAPMQETVVATENLTQPQPIDKKTQIINQAITLYQDSQNDQSTVVKNTISEQQPIAPKPSTSAGMSTTEQILGIDANRYTLQLMSATKLNHILNYIQQYKLEKDGIYFRTTRQGKDWYILIYGNYASLEAAEQAIGKLPPPLRKAKPWIRRFSGIHESLKA